MRTRRPSARRGGLGGVPNSSGFVPSRSHKFMVEDTGFQASFCVLYIYTHMVTQKVVHGGGGPERYIYIHTHKTKGMPFKAINESNWHLRKESSHCSP